MRGVVLVKQTKEGRGLGYVEKFHDAARRIPGVVDSYPVLGRFDDVVWLETKDYESLLGAKRRLGAIPGVKSTETLTEGP